MSAVHGRCDERFTALKALAENLAVEDDDGFVLAVEVDGELVVDLWVGRTPEASLIHTFSKVKPLAACALLLAHDDGTDANLIAALGIMVTLAEGDLNTALSIAATMSEPVESTQAIGLAAVHTWTGQFEQARRYIAIARELGASEPSDYAIAVAPQLSISHAVIARTTTEPHSRQTASARAIDLIRRAPEPFTNAYVHALVADSALENDDPNGITWLAEAQRAVDGCTDPGIAGRLVARVKSRHGQTTRPSSQAWLAEELTDREIAVLRYLPSPMSQRDIAGELFVSLNTVKTHCREIYRKLAVTDRKAALQAARDASLL